MNHCKTIALVNQKGGVGKTTSTINLGVGLASQGNKVLLVDGDPQHSLTIGLGITDPDNLEHTLNTAMLAEIEGETPKWEEGIIHHREGVDLLPANDELAGIELRLFSAMSREQVLKSVLSHVKDRYDYQTCVKLYSPQVETLRAYFKINVPNPGAIALVKTTEDGQNLSGWRFGVYSNAACTTLVSGPHTTDSSGKISITGLNAGTYYVKELGHSDSSISSRYTCSGDNPQKVSVSNGATICNEERLLSAISQKEGESVRFLASVLREYKNESNNMADALRDYEEYVEGWAHEAKTPLSLLTMLLDNRNDEISPSLQAYPH